MVTRSTWMLSVATLPAASRATAVMVLVPSTRGTSATNVPGPKVAGIPLTSTATTDSLTVPVTLIGLVLNRLKLAGDVMLTWGSEITTSTKSSRSTTDKRPAVHNGPLTVASIPTAASCKTMALAIPMFSASTALMHKPVNPAENPASTRSCWASPTSMDCTAPSKVGKLGTWYKSARQLSGIRLVQNERVPSARAFKSLHRQRRYELAGQPRVFITLSRSYCGFLR